ncbi:MAG: long-chain fatty acid--CoA ligase [Elusimicrobia bacterium RIFOXYB2_FULL_48_7]|nr:MAG: long-chain fatty acid--CoA ligase [Elusimicrobia bacterium RIFOXYB2_FULL_48_7]
MQGRTINGLVRESIINHWDHPAFSDHNGQTLCFCETAEKIRQLHYLFKQHKIEKGDKIALLGPNCANWAVVYLSAISYGAVIVPILPDFHAEDIHHIINHSDSVALFVSEEISETIEEEKIRKVRAIFLLDSGKRDEYLGTDYNYLFDPKLLKGHSRNAGNPVTREEFNFPGNAAGNDLAAIVYTSGTTGFSKGVMLSHDSLAANVVYARERLQLKPGHTVLSILPLAHAFGCSFEFLYPFTLGCHVTFLGKIPSPKIIINAFRDIRPSIVFSVPLIIEKIHKKIVNSFTGKKTVKFLAGIPVFDSLINILLKKKLHRIFGGRLIELVIGGAALNPAVEQFLHKIGFPFAVGYGMTECGPLISYSRFYEHRLGSAGQTIRFLEAKIDSEDPYNKIGEIMVKGVNVMKGYYKNDEATGSVLDPEGWLRTGDLGVLDAENFIYIKGRSKNVIIGPSGQNIYPEEIENKLNALPFVQESLVSGESGKIVAFVYPDFELADEKKLNENDLQKIMEENRQAVNAMLPAYSPVSKIKIAPEGFMKTPTKKIKRFLYESYMKN